VPSAVDDEARRAQQVHRLVGEALRPDLAERQQRISGKDERRADPPDDVDRERGQAASLRNT
jgi:hypothetical protein